MGSFQVQQFLVGWKHPGWLGDIWQQSVSSLEFCHFHICACIVMRY